MTNLIETEDKVISLIKGNKLEQAIDIYKHTYTNNIKTILFKDKNTSKNKLLNYKKYIVLSLLTNANRMLLKKNPIELDSIIINLENKDELEDIDEYVIETIETITKYYFKENPQFNNIVEKAIEYIYDNYEKDITLESLSQHLHISKNHLSHIFIKNTGLKFTNFINNVRIDKSKKLINETNSSISYISNICGFKNQSYFSTVFKKYEKISPLEYRKKSRLQ